MEIANAKVDVWAGFKRNIIQFKGRDAWIVEPKEPAQGMPWSWCLEWPCAYVNRNGVTELLEKGFHHVHITAKGHGNDEDQKVFAEFHDYLVKEFGFAKKAGLIGMSFGGLYSSRYAAFNPEKVACIYLDAPVCNFFHFPYIDLVREEYGLNDSSDYLDYPGLPVNLTEKLKDFPILLIYGKDDIVVPPADNCELLLSRLKKQNGSGSVEVIARDAWGHHPHGLDDTEKIVNFMIQHCC